MRTTFPREWRTQSKWKRRFYTKYMTWLERFGYLLVTLVIGGFIFAFQYRVDDVISADGVEISGISQEISAPDSVLLRRVVAQHGQTVKAGDVLYEYVVANNSLSGSAETQQIVSPQAGVFLAIDGKEPDYFEKGHVLGKVVDYSKLTLSASLSGQSTPNANVGQTARISLIVVQPEAPTMFRGEGDQGSIVAGQSLPQKTLDAMQQKLSGQSVLGRDDKPLAIDSISEVQLDAHYSSVAQSLNSTNLLNPPAGFTAKATVVSGQHMATMQLADFPNGLREELLRLVQEGLKEQGFSPLNGNPFSIAEINQPDLVIKVKAKDIADGADSPLKGVSVSRAFDAKLEIVDPSAELVELIKKANLAGLRVVAKVELKTGDRPIALLLLKKS